MDTDYLKVSNGSGDPALMHITADRLTGATTISVDTVINIPAKFIATYGTVGSDGYITAASKRDFKGHLSGSALIIDAFEPGNADAGNTAGQVVVIRPNTGWANRVAQVIGAIYPVGCIYTTVDPTNPATLFGFGTWVAFGVGRTIVGVDTGQTEFNTVEKTGGEKAHALTAGEMPAHSHVVEGHFGGAFAAGSPDMPMIYGSGGGGSNYNYSTDPTGGGGSHNNLQPYITAYFWKRTA